LFFAGQPAPNTTRAGCNVSVFRFSLTQACYALLALVLLSPSVWAASKSSLPKQYREFLDGPTSLLLTKDERGSFLHLASDDQRDHFIEHFWEVRNPAPGSGTNEFKEEFYRRIAYANAFYAKDSGSTTGWRTDRGRTYVLFGKPQTSMDFQGNQRLFATELWFYSNPGLSELPPFFYVLFYQPNGAGGFKVYRPYVDTPDKLLVEGGTDVSQAYNYLRNFNVELANATLTSIPGEPVDTTNFTGSMASLPIVDAIYGYASMPSYVSLIRQRELRTEHVTSKVLYSPEQAELIAFLVTEGGHPWMHWRMEIRDLAGLSWTNNSLHLDVDWKLYSQGRLVYEQTDKPSLGIPPDTKVDVTKSPVAFADKTPVETGRYQLVVEIKNPSTGRIYSANREFEVRAAADRTGIADVLVVSKHRPDPRPRPFAFSGVEFLAAPHGSIAASRGLSLLYQIQLPSPRPESLTVHYTVGSAAGTARKTFEDKLDVSKADEAGALLIAKTLPIEEFGPGAYRLSIQVQDPASKLLSTAAVPFTVAVEPEENPITISRGQGETPQDQATVEYQRALCQLAQSRPSEAIQDLQTAWELNKNPAVKNLLDRLSALHTEASTREATGRRE
jgi:GWxTD domain-containing protein